MSIHYKWENENPSKWNVFFSILKMNSFRSYRKALKAMEEDIVLPKSIAPCMYVTEDKVPVNTNSELVLFCRRVYEFRLKRLIKNPS